MSAEDTVHDTADELRALLSEAEEVLAGTGNVAEERVRELRDRLRAAVDQGRDRFAQARESAREQFDRADEYVHAHPYYAVGLAAIVGVIAGLLVGRRD